METKAQLFRIVVLLGILAVHSANAGTSFLDGDELLVPRIDVDGFGALELLFQVEYDGDYRLVLSESSEANQNVANSGVFDIASYSLSLDEVQLQDGSAYSVELTLLSDSPRVVFAISTAVLLRQPAAPSSENPSSSATAGLYSELCASCHGDSGQGSSIGPSLIGCANCTSSGALASYISATMPLGQTAACDQQCADSLSGYILQELGEVQQAQSSRIVGFIRTMSHQDALRKAALELNSRLPERSELELVAARGEQGLSEAIEGMMERDAFYNRLTEIFNDYFLTDKYMSRNGSEAAIGLLSNDDFPARRWFDPGKENRGEDYSKLRRHTNDGIAREPLELINYVVRTNRPFTEILTADYMMMNPYSARSYGVNNPIFDDPDDPAEFRAVALQEIPHAGILTSPMFLNRYPTTSTNRNRGRARVVFDLFLDTDILAIEGVRPGNSVDISTPVPTINNPNCSKCHAILDPVASIFQNWDHKGRYRPSRLSRYGWYSDMEVRGFNGEAMPLSGNVDSSVRWLAGKIAQDPRFPRAVTRILVRGLTGKEPLKAPVDDDGSQQRMDAFVAERAVLNEVQARFVASNYNLKSLVKEIVLNPYWRADGLASGANLDAHEDTGASYLLTPEQLDRKILALFGFEWRNSLDSYYKDQNSFWASKLQNRFHQIYGGIDSDSITSRLTSPNGLMGAMQLRLANELACYAVPHDFWLPESQRRLFQHVGHDDSPYNEAGNIDQQVMARVRQNIVYLHEYLLGESLSPQSSEVQITEQLFLNTINRGRQLILSNAGEWWVTRLPDQCDRTRDLQGNSLNPDGGDDNRLINDPQFVIRAWMAVVAYLLSDYKFFYG